jgi:hypothetical protein
MVAASPSAPSSSGPLGISATSRRADLCGLGTGEALVPPAQARMVDTCSDYTGCWADVYDDDHEEMQACEANPDPSRVLGLCAEHDAQMVAIMKQDA